MQTQYISFCNGNALNIKSNAVKSKILDTLATDFDIRIIDKHHEIFCERKHIHRVTKVPHVVSIRSNGNPYYMFLTRIDFINTIIMIDKKVQMGYTLPRMIIIRLRVHDDNLFENTLLEGEMIHDKNNKWLFLISDLHIMYNKSLKELDVFKRINMLYDMLRKDFRRHFLDLFCIQVKKYVELSNIRWLCSDFTRSLPYTIRGVYVKPIFSRFKDILLNINDSLVKQPVKTKYARDEHFIADGIPPLDDDSDCCYKRMQSEKKHTDMTNDTDNSTRHMLLQKTNVPDCYTLFDEDNARIGVACVDCLKTSKMLSDCFKNKSLMIKLKFICKYTTNPNFKNKWIPVKMIS
jgi:hypothetical protein